MYKKLSIIIGITAITAGIFGWQMTSFSQSESIHAKDCNNNACCIAYREGISNVENTWMNNMANMMNQEKPASTMVGEGMENLRAYQCWLEYICKAVEFSGYGTPENAETGLSSKHLGVIPGCQAPENMGMVGSWDNFVNFLKSDWEVVKNTLKGGGAEEAKLTMPSALFTTNAFPFMPQCMTDPTNRNAEPKIQLATQYYSQCISFVDKKVNIGFIKLENELRRNNARQKSGIIENKMVSILQKIKNMEVNVTIMKEKLTEINNKSVCYPPSCS